MTSAVRSSDIVKILGWAGHIRVDGTNYRWLGDDAQAPSIPGNLTGKQFTPTRSIFQVQAGPMNLNVTFLSPIEVRSLSFLIMELIYLKTKLQPQDWVKQSFPFAYITVEGSSADGLPHNVQLYSDISGGEMRGVENYI